MSCRLSSSSGWMRCGAGAAGRRGRARGRGKCRECIRRRCTPVNGRLLVDGVAGLADRSCPHQVTAAVEVLVAELLGSIRGGCEADPDGAAAPRRRRSAGGAHNRADHAPARAGTCAPPACAPTRSAMCRLTTPLPFRLPRQSGGGTSSASCRRRTPPPPKAPASPRRRQQPCAAGDSHEQGRQHRGAELERVRVAVPYGTEEHRPDDGDTERVADLLHRR